MRKQQAYDIIVDNLPVGFSVVDENGVIVDYNDAAERITGYSKKDVIGKSHFELFHAGTERESCPLCRHALDHHEQSIGDEIVMRKKGGETIAIFVTVSPIFDREGKFIGAVELFRDITASKKLERERKNILSMFAHDMKNPVIAAVGFLSRLLVGKAECRKDYLELIRDELRTVESLITDFLEFARLEAKEYQPAFSSFDVAAEITKLVEHSLFEAERKNQRIVCDLPRVFPVVRADASMIKRVITNLLENAIKYTAPGGTITVSLRDRGTDLLVQIKDTGIGIAESHLPYVFDAFYRVSREQKGSGLGLSIAKTIVEAHGGEIWVHSAPGEGSTFSFSLPKR